MSYKKLSVAMLAFFAAIGGSMIYYAQFLKIQKGALFVNGSRFFPMLLGGLIAISCIASIVDTLKKDDSIVEIPNLKNPLISLSLTIAWVFFWRYTGYFYAVSFFFVGLFMFIFNPEKVSFDKFRKTVVYDVIIVIAIYLIFTVALKTHL